ncbi:type IV secretory system conjugative DNA transfer family protein [Streptantibioticus rubrisoli]|uniref:TraM recognition domain-containing protein n=1 Tax=Streptantibioticus rubrisoli TaxID=1387313 RepID=A0ABT1PKX4_9ACTN|nr:TraM recognition domain-containing protein [Streptantibioticus rubrisoli]MCQ4046013.1 TraM recognition domain-containing protein [Streptantibioticus rubrisoli]
MTQQRREGGIPDGLLVAIIGFLLGVTVLVWTGTGLAGLISHGHWPDDLHFTRTPVAMRELISQPKDMVAAWPQVPAADLPRPGLFWGVFIGEVLVLLVLLGFAIGTITRYRAVRAAAHQARNARPAARPTPLPRQKRTDAAPGPVIEAAPREGELTGHMPEVPVTVRAEPAAPTVASPDRLPDGQLTGSHVLFANPRGSDKGKRIIYPTVLDAEGPVIVTCADAQTWQQTVSVRAKLGPVHLFDPEHLVDAPGRLRWAPHHGCQDPAVAASRARALLAPLRTHDVTANDAAVTLLRCWLHAAAIDSQPFRQLHRWASGSGAADPVRILRTARDAASGWSGELEATLHAHPERRDTAQGLIQHALSGLNSIHIRDACNPGRADGLDLESFVNERGTLYVVGEPREDPRAHPGAMPLLTALVSSVVEHGRRMAAGSSPGRLDPPMTFVLDDIATLAPIPELPALMSEGPTAGIPVLAVLRSEEQARHRWPRQEAESIWRSATSRMTEGG